jgi:RNA polymerase sigma-70 factor (ECF subfamily)
VGQSGLRRELYGHGSKPASPSAFGEAAVEDSYPEGAAAGTAQQEAVESRAERWKRDFELMQRAAGRDAAAQEEVVLRVMPRTSAVCRSILGAREEHTDAIQTALEAVLRSAPRFRGECALETWSERIAVRTALRAARRQRRFRLFASREEEEALDLPAPEPAAGGDALPRTLQAYLDALPAARREVLVLRYRLDHSIPDIATETGLNINTVKYRLKQGLQQLRALVRRDLALRGKGSP